MVIRKYNSLAAELLASKEILLLFGSFKSNIGPSALSFFFSFVFFFFLGGGGVKKIYCISLVIDDLLPMDFLTLAI